MGMTASTMGGPCACAEKDDNMGYTEYDQSRKKLHIGKLPPDYNDGDITLACLTENHLGGLISATTSPGFICFDSALRPDHRNLPPTDYFSGKAPTLEVRLT